MSGTSADSKKKTGKKRKPIFHRFQTHSNPLSDQPFDYPITPADMDWSVHYPRYCNPLGQPNTIAEPKKVSFVDIGCGFGGLTVSLGSAFPDVLTLGLEIRRPVVQHVATRIQQLRAANAESGAYGNISVLATNAMKYLPNLFEKAQLSKMFFLFPDPHFKRKNHRRRIISRTLLAVYAYLLRVGGTLYTITDVKDLADWMQSYLDQSPLFRRLSDAELADDPCATMIQNVSEEAKKVSRASGNKHMAIYRRIEATNSTTLTSTAAAATTTTTQ